MKALFELSGKQFCLGEGDVFLANRVGTDVGENFTVDKVLSIVDGESTRVGKPSIEGATVELKVLNHGRAKKVVVQKYRPKENYRIRKGHKQEQSQLQLVKIHAGE
jgi:large subunit ribosomal protein L21